MKRTLAYLKKLIPHRTEYLPAPSIPVVIIQDEGEPIRMYPGDTMELKWTTNYRPGIPGKEATFIYNDKKITVGINETRAITRYIHIFYGEDQL